MGALSMSRRRFGTLLGGTAVLGISPLVAAQDFPIKGKPIRILVPFPPGGGTDAQARLLSQKLPDLLGVPVIVDNKPGASTMLAASEVARAAPDGNTILYAPSSTMAQNPHTLAQVSYDPFKDFTAISLGGRGPLVLMVSSAVPAYNVGELVDYIKAHPGQVSYASFGTGTSSHIYGEVFVKKTGTDAVHVPYKGGADAAKDLIGGRVQYMFDSASSAIITSGSGKAKIIAVAAPTRIEVLPNVPTMTEAGVPGLDLPSWLGFYGPAKMPASVVHTLNAALVQVLAMPDVKEFYRQGGYEAGGSTPEEFAQLTRATYDRWGILVQQIGFKKQ
jgi:tripartite-type tricarboxylate transporter receptor subunit TctC